MEKCLSPKQDDVGSNPASSADLKKEPKCELCNLEKRTKWYYEDEVYIILECETCRIPMVVSKDHNFKVEIGTLHHSVLYGIVRGVFGGKRYNFRTVQRKVKNHWHWHIEIYV